MKKINFKQPKYILPLVAFIPLVFLIYNIAGIFGGENKAESKVVTDSINTALPEADEQQVDGKLDAMNKAEWMGENYTALGRLGEDTVAREEIPHGYTEAELDAIDKKNAAADQAAKERAELERTLAESRRHVNSYKYGGRASAHNSFNTSYSSRSQYDELADYAQALDEIQQRNRGRYSNSYGETEQNPTPKQEEAVPSAKSSQKSLEAKPELVYKTLEKGAEKFHTLHPKSSAENSLIKAIIDKTTKAKTGTRLRFKLLDAVTIKGVHIPKGTYLYGVVTGFEGQRVLASISSILLKDKLVKVNLSVYDNDGMEGFYVPSSVFRTFVKDASASAVNGNMNFNGTTASEISAETMALQALQNVYSSATSAISNNIRQDKARIKYNTTVYLINASQSEEN